MFNERWFLMEGGEVRGRKPSRGSGGRVTFCGRRGDGVRELNTVNINKVFMFH